MLHIINRNNIYGTYLAVEVIISIASLTERAVVTLLPQLKARSAERQAAHELTHTGAVATLALQACTAYLELLL